MKIIIRKLDTKVDVQTCVSAEIDPEWRHTSQIGTVYRYDMATKKLDPLPSEVREVHVGCPDPEVCGGCEGWYETHYLDDAGDRLIPVRRQKTRLFQGLARASGWCEITEATRDEIESLEGSVFRFDDPRVVAGNLLRLRDDMFKLSQVKSEGYNNRIVGRLEVLPMERLTIEEPPQ